MSIDFDSIEVRDVNYLSSFFKGDILFVLSPVPFGVISVYGRSMDDLDKICNGYPWCTIKPQISKLILN